MRKHYFFALLCGLASVVLAGCVEELPEERRALSGRGIGFSTSVVNGWDEPSETRGSHSASVGDPVQMEGGRQTLYLHAEVVDGISSHKTGRVVVNDAQDNKFTPPMSDESASTRGVMRTASNLYASFGVLGYSFSSSWDGTQTPNLMYNVEATKGSSVYETGVYWPASDDNVRFYAYAPYSEADGVEGLTVSDASQAGVPTLTYEVPEDVTKQSDLLATLCDETATTAHTSPQSIEFHHLLTAVCFKIGDNMAAGTINKITLKNIKYKGTYAFPAATPWTSDKGSWAVDDDVKDFSCSLDFTTDGTANVQVNTGENVFMMLPQTLGDDAVVEVEFTADGESAAETYSANINGLAVWEQGKTTTYAISLDPNAAKYFLTVTPPSDSYVYTGETKSLSVTSYKEEGGTQSPLGWTITAMEYSYDDGATWSTVSSQLTFSATTGTGGTSPSDLTAQVKQTGYLTGQPFDDALTNAEEVTTRRDLSYYDVNGNSTGSRNTANCYVVRAPGKYRIPCVYGNAIKNGATNASSYTSTLDVEAFLQKEYEFMCTDATYSQAYPTEESKQYFLSNWRTTINLSTMWHFKNAYNDDISDPWIHKNQHDGSAIVPTTAEIAWQDYDGMIRNENIAVTHSGDEYYVDFDVKKEDMCLGNAVIQLKDAAGIVQWTWHIWMTSADLTTAGPFTSQTSKQYSFLPQPVGYVEKEVVLNYLPRLFRVKVVQAESGKEAVFNLMQSGDNSTTDIYYAAPYYQFGRMAPMPMEDIDAFVIDERASNESSPFIYEAIRTPCVFYAHPGSSGSTDKNWHGGNGDQTETTAGPRIDNLWDANYTAYEVGVNGNQGAFTDNPVIKTVYDPSPAGFHVPENNAFTGFDNGEAVWRSDVNSSDYTYGYSVILKQDGKQLIIPAYGQREQDGQIEYYPYWGMFWMSGKANYWGDAMYFLTNPVGSAGAYTVNLRVGQKLSDGRPYFGIGDACQAYNVIPAADRD